MGFLLQDIVVFFIKSHYYRITQISLPVQLPGNFSFWHESPDKSTCQPICLGRPALRVSDTDGTYAARLLCLLRHGTPGDATNLCHPCSLGSGNPCRNEKQELCQQHCPHHLATICEGGCKTDGQQFSVWRETPSFRHGCRNPGHGR